jgi:hypothetical protein
MVKPISLRLRASEATADARKLLRRLDENDRLQRRAKWHAVRALVELQKLRTVARPALKSLFTSDAARWESDCARVEQILRRISERGVR